MLSRKLDLSAGLCVGDLRFDARPAADQYATCQRCPVRGLCPQPTTKPYHVTPRTAPGCDNHDQHTPQCGACRAWIHTNDHEPDWGMYGGRRRCLICMAQYREAKTGKPAETRVVPWQDVLDTLDRYQIGQNYAWGLIVADLGTTAEALCRRLDRRGLRGLAKLLLSSNEYKTARPSRSKHPKRRAA